MDKIAVYIAGNKKITTAGIVAISSFLKYSKLNLDCFIFLDEVDIGIEEKKLLDKYSIKIINYDESLICFPNYEDKKRNYYWPKQVYYSYYVPYILLEMGYEYSIKIDYDVLCVGAIDIEKILPKHHTFSGINHKILLADMLFDDEYFSKEIGGELLKSKEVSTNVGVLVINNKKYIKEDVYNKIIQVYENMKINYNGYKKIESLFFADQGLFCLTLAYFPEIRKKELPKEYNYLVHSENNDISNVKIIHYASKIKPWNKIPALKEYIKNYNSMKFREYWQEYYLSDTDLSSLKFEFLFTKKKEEMYKRINCISYVLSMFYRFYIFITKCFRRKK